MAKYQEILDAIGELKEGFGRMDERTRNTYHLVEKLERHNDEQNGYIREQSRQVASNKTSIGRLWWLIGIIATSSSGTAGITKLLGLW